MGLGMTEVLVILVIALIVFGPRKLPDLGKSLGQAMSQFRRASDDFKRTWEQEVETEKIRKDLTLEPQTTTSYDDNSTESNDPYNPYSDNTETTTETSDQAKTEAVPATAETPVNSAGQTQEQRHWI
ncbi:MAG: twin-arginine translocase TatA/TatE family subunit [Acidobacteria bacterium]|nr:twin-arginine translocase TatA/TatE family subunit [Acidobacteriota bacterium]